MVGTTISHYKILEKIGAGGMGEVFLAQDTSLDRKVALKFLSDFLREDPTARKRFLREAKSAAALDHPFICHIHEVGEEDGKDFIAMEYVRGHTLKDKLAKGPLPLNDAIEKAVEIAEALEEAHKQGIVHRDLKPSNIMVTPQGHVKVMDFGLAKRLVPAEGVGSQAETLTGSLTKTDTTMGTLAYMSPEQLRGEEVDTRSDVFSFGVVLYEMMAGVHPFLKPQRMETASAILRDEPSPLGHYVPDLPEVLEHTVKKMLAKHHQHRYESAREVRVDLEQPVGAQTEVETPNQPSIAVLPFVNMSPDPDNEYFSDGLTEELINALTQVDGLQVAARTSAFHFKGRTEDIREIGKHLNVNTILAGSIRKSGQLLRITAQLVNADDGYHLWSERYDREIEDIFEVQDEIARTVVDKLRVRLLIDPKKPLVKVHTDKPEAYEAYLKGRFFWNKRTPNGLKDALELFQKAVELDPGYALAYSGIADVYNLLGFLWVLPPNEAHPMAKSAAKRALEMDNTLAEAHTSLALVSAAFDWNWPDAEREFQRAIALSPDYASARHFYAAYYLSPMGRHEEALAEMRRAYELDPFAPVLSADTAFVLLMAHRYDQTIEQCLKTLERFPDFPVTYYYLVYAYVQKGLYDEAIDASRKAVSLGGSAAMYLAGLGHALAAAGKRDEAFQVLDELIERTSSGPVPPYQMALIYTSLGEKEQAFEWLEKAVQEHTWQLPWLRVEPGFGPLRSDPRFQDLLRRVNLIEP